MLRKIAILLMLSVLFFCASENRVNSNRYVTLSGSERDAFIAQINAEREETDDYFRNHPESPIAAVARLQVNETDSAQIQCIVQENGDYEIELNVNSQAFICFRFNGQKYQIVEPKSGLELDGKSYQGENFSDGVIQGQRYVFAMYGSAAIIIYDLASPAREKFSGKSYYPIDSRWQLEGSVVPANANRIVEMPTSRGLMKQFRAFGIVRLTIGGQSADLTLYQSAWLPETFDELFLPFTDQTTGKETYSTGRYLDLKKPAPGQKLVVDFNRAYYPLCYYSPHYNCPIPPAENRIPMAITAGEKGTHAHE